MGARVWPYTLQDGVAQVREPGLLVLVLHVGMEREAASCGARRRHPSFQGCAARRGLPLARLAALAHAFSTRLQCASCLPL